MESIARYLDGKVQIIVGDITRDSVDAIVNAANTSLLGGGGVDGAIHRAGGPAIVDACREIRRTQCPDGLPAGEAVITTGGQLPARFVIHTVGPIYGKHSGKEAALLAHCYRNSLALAREYGLATVSFPAISTGVYGYPREEAATVVSHTLSEWFMSAGPIEMVRLVFFSRGDANVFIANQVFAGS